MTKWEDTVLNDEEMLTCSLVSKYPFRSIVDVIRETAIHQAEKTWPIAGKAGYEQAREEMNLQSTSLADLCLEHRKGGIKEVVDWIEDNKFSLVAMDNYCDFGVDNAKWQAKLKEWGI